MKGLTAITRRELAGLFLQPLAWVLLCLALLVQGFFLTLFLQQSGGDVRSALLSGFGNFNFWILTMLLAPLLTMRMISEESRSGLLEFLLTAPVSDFAVVLGKQLAATAFFAILWSSTLFFAIGAAWLGAEVDWAQVLVGYSGAVLVSALFCAIGLFTSSLTQTPVLAAFLAFLIGLTMIVLPGVLGKYWTRSWGLDDQWLAAATTKFDLSQRYMNSFLLGTVDTGHVVFFLTWIGLFVFLSVRLLEMRRWR